MAHQLFIVDEVGETLEATINMLFLSLFDLQNEFIDQVVVKGWARA
ncbi:hypothetical protein [Palleronia caenipelagi]|nr:hypothetical protein [Palleronia caenipelagi]